MHLYQTGATDIFTRRKCPCLRTSKTKLRLRGKGTFAAEVGVSSSSNIFLDYAWKGESTYMNLWILVHKDGSQLLEYLLCYRTSSFYCTDICYFRKAFFLCQSAMHGRTPSPHVQGMWVLRATATPGLQVSALRAPRGSTRALNYFPFGRRGYRLTSPVHCVHWTLGFGSQENATKEKTRPKNWKLPFSMPSQPATLPRTFMK